MAGVVKCLSLTTLSQMEHGAKALPFLTTCRFTIAPKRTLISQQFDGKERLGVGARFRTQLSMVVLDGLCLSYAPTM